MLRKNERITITGESIIDETVVCTFTALFNDLEHPENVGIVQNQKDKELYKENRTACRADFAEFEDYVYARQEELLKAKGAEA